MVRSKLMSAAFIASALVSTASVSAAIIPGDVADGNTRFYGIEAASSPSVALFQFGDENDSAPAFVFQLPDLGADATFDSASLELTVINSGSDTSFSGIGDLSADLFGLDARSTATFEQAFIGGSWQGDHSNGTLLIDNAFGDEVTPDGTVISLDVTDYLNTQYAGGDNVGDFVILRLQLDLISGSNNRVVFHSADSLSEGSRPFIEYAISSTPEIPEPSSLALLLAGVTAICCRRSS